MRSEQGEQIVLIQPPIQDFYQTAIRQEPLGLEYLAAVLRQNGFQVKIIDALAKNSKFTIPIPSELKYLQPYYPLGDLSPFKLFGHYYHFGADFKEIAAILKRTKPALIGISANFTPYFEMTIQVAQICKQLFPEIPVVVGGHHVTAVPEEVLNLSVFDYVVLGEGELSLLKLAQALFRFDYSALKQIPGLAFRKESKIVINLPLENIQNLDALPIPTLTSEFAYKMILSSRGCPKNCRFCTIRMVMGTRVRTRTIANVLNELQYWHQQGQHAFDFEDDNLLFYRERAVLLMQGIIDKFGLRELELSAMNGLSVENLDSSLLRLMYQAGFNWLNLPLVSGAVSIQSDIGRKQKRRQFYEVIRTAPKHRLRVVAYLILGLPQDSLDHMITDILDLTREQVLIGPSVFYPPPGSSIYEECITHGYFQPGSYLCCRSTAIPVETKNFGREDLITLFRMIRLINYLKGLIDNNVIPEENMLGWLKQFHLPSLTFASRLSKNKIGLFLLNRFIFHKQLIGLRLIKKRGNQFSYEIIEYMISSRVLETFYRRFIGIKIRGVTSGRAVTIN